MGGGGSRKSSWSHVHIFWTAPNSKSYIKFKLIANLPYNLYKQT